MHAKFPILYMRNLLRKNTNIWRSYELNGRTILMLIISLKETQPIFLEYKMSTVSYVEENELYRVRPCFKSQLWLIYVCSFIQQICPTFKHCAAKLQADCLTSLSFYFITLKKMVNIIYNQGDCKTCINTQCKRANKMNIRFLFCFECVIKFPNLRLRNSTYVFKMSWSWQWRI